MPALEEATRNREKIADIKRRYALGIISREQAKIEAESVIRCINKKGQEIALKHKVKYYPVDFINLMR